MINHTYRDHTHATLARPLCLAQSHLPLAELMAIRKPTTTTAPSDYCPRTNSAMISPLVRIYRCGRLAPSSSATSDAARHPSWSQTERRTFAPLYLTFPESINKCMRLHIRSPHYMQLSKPKQKVNTES
jgi:hypothetical protein